MAKHEKQKAGLHKGISSIFKGVSIPQADGDQEPSGTSAPERTDYTKPKPLIPVLQKSEVTKAYQATQTLPKAAPGHTDYTEPKQPTPEPQKTQAQKSYQVTPSLPKAATAQQSKAEPAQRPKAEPVQKPKAEPVQKPKAEPTRQPKADIDKKVSKKSPTVKISSQSFLQQIKNKLFKPKSGVSTSTTKQKAMVVMMPLLFIVLIFMLSRGGVFGTSAGRTEASTEDTAPGVVTAGAYTKIDWEIPAPYPTTLRDPMRLVPVEIPQAEISKTLKLIVKGILYSEDNPSAVIGNQIVHEGETIRGVSVIKISQDSVEFEMNGKRWTQKIRQ
jgi:outer membrane biosynthesis protein TonB